MVLLTAILGKELAELFWEHADQMEQNLCAYYKPYLHPEDVTALEDAVAGRDFDTCRSLVLRYGLRYIVDSLPHRWAVDDPYYVRPTAPGKAQKQRRPE